MKKILAALALWLALAGAAAAQTCPSYSFIFTPNTGIASAQVNSNFATIRNCANAFLAPLASPVFTGTVTLSNPLAPTSGGTGLAALTAHDLLIGNGAAAANLLAPGTQGQAVISNGASADPSYGVPVLRSYLAGMILSNDATTANAVLDIAAGQAADSANVTMIALGQTFFKSTGGAWAAGPGAGGSPKTGMGTGLTIANATWYHVCAIINAAAADVYFDTDAACTANSPASTTARRRVGSFLTDGSAHIIAFTQRGDNVSWNTIPALDINTSLSTTPADFTLANVPLGVVVEAVMHVEADTVTNNAGIYVYSKTTADQAASLGSTPLMSVGTQESGTTTSEIIAQVRVFTDTAQKVRAVAVTGSNAIRAVVISWNDTRGRSN